MAGIDSKGESLIDAVRDGNEKQVGDLIQGGASVNMADEDGRTALMHIFRYRPRNLDYIKRLQIQADIGMRLIKGGADVNMKDKEGQTALMHASSCGKDEIVRMLIMYSPKLDLNVGDHGGNTALMYAIAQKEEDIAMIIIEKSKDVDLNMVDKQGQTALMKAIIRKMTNVAVALIKSGSDVNIKDGQENTALVYATDGGHETLALAIIEHSKDLDLNMVDNQRQTALMKATIRGMTETAVALIKGGANVNLRDRQGNTALVYATDGGHENIALAIIEHSKDLDLNIPDNGGQTALTKAIIRRMTKCALAMIKTGTANVNMKDKDGKTALMHAIENERDYIAVQLIDKDLHLDISDNKGQTAMMKAAIRGMTKVTRLLIKRGANVNTKDKESETALLHSITSKEKEDTALAIIEHGKDLDVNICDHDGRTALIKAAICGTTKVALELIKRGADANMKDKQGQTALMHSIFLKKEHTALAIIENSQDIDLNIVDNQGQTTLMKAAITRMLNVTIALIKHGADVNIKEEFKEGKTALMYAVAWKEEDAALAIIEHSQDIDLNIADNEGQTALIGATLEGMTKFALALIRRGADVSMQDNKGQTALMYAIANKREDIAVTIIEHSNELDLNTVADNQGQTLMMKATINGMTKLVGALIKGGANVNKRDNEGKTALMFIGSIMEDEDSDIVAGELTLKLISADATVNMTDFKGNTALMYNVKYETSVKALIQQGKASVTISNNDGRTALFNAIVENNAVVRFLLENGSKPHLTDKYNISVLMYYIHHFLDGQVSSIDIPVKLHQAVDLLEEPHDSVIKTIINAVFCKCPHFFLKVHSVKAPWEIILTTLKVASEFSQNGDDKTKETLKDLITMTDLIADKKPEIPKDHFFSLFEKMVVLVDDPNIRDIQGNDIFHHVTNLGLRGYLTKEDVSNVCHLLEGIGFTTNIDDYRSKETPLIFALSSSIQLVESGNLHMGQLIEICRLLLQRGYPSLKDVSQDGESIFHLIIKLLGIGITTEWNQVENFLFNVLQLLQLFSPPTMIEGVNDPDRDLNTPLHLFAEISLPFQGKKPYDISSEVTIWQGFSEKIFHQLLSCGAMPHAKNKKGETALHLCKTWTVFTLLVKAGANTKDGDLTGRSPLLSSVEKCLTQDHPGGHLYPDLPPTFGFATFWNKLRDMGFDLWSCDKNDKNGDSIISNLIRRNSFELADSLIDITCGGSKMVSDDTLVDMLDTICKDDSTQTTWKSVLVEKLLKSARHPLDVSAPLQSCALNIKHQYTCGRTESDSTVHCEIVRKLLTYSPNSRKSCLNFAKGCPPFEALLLTPINSDDAPMMIPWTSFSNTYKDMLAAVARKQNFKSQGPYLYHTKPIGSGGFGNVFVGINEKDGMEVAIKKIDNSRKNRAEDLREIRTFASLPKCEHIVRYLTFLPTADFSYIVMELMEGNLVEYFVSPSYDRSKSQMLCRNVTQGLKYLHEQNIIHRDIKPTNILYKTHPKLCLKISDFGLSHCLDSEASFTVMATGVGTRGWIAPEVMKSTTHEYFMSSDIFSLGLVLHYTLSDKRHHPFGPADTEQMSDLEINNATERNVLENKMEGWDNSLDTEVSDLILEMLRVNKNERPPATTLLQHPMYWSKKKKLEFLSAVGNQGEFECPRDKRTVPLTMVEQDLENEFPAIVKFGSWGDPRYTQTVAILNEMKKPITRPDGTIQRVRKNYDSGSVVELVRLIRNAIAHVSESSRPPSIRKEILEDAVFLGEFPKLVLEVFKAVTKHGWDVSREEIKQVFAND